MKTAQLSIKLALFLVVLVWLPFAAQGTSSFYSDSDSKPKTVKKNQFAKQNGIQQIAKVAEKSFEITTSLPNISNLTITIVSSDANSKKYTLQGKGQERISLFTIYPEKVVEIAQYANINAYQQQFSPKSSTVIDFNMLVTAQDSAKIPQNDLSLVKILATAEKLNFSTSGHFEETSHIVSKTQVTAFGNSVEELQALLHKKAGQQCTSDKPFIDKTSEELVILPSHSSKGKFYGTYTFECKQ